MALLFVVIMISLHLVFGCHIFQKSQGLAQVSVKTLKFLIRKFRYNEKINKLTQEKEDERSINLSLDYKCLK